MSCHVILFYVLDCIDNIHAALEGEEKQRYLSCLGSRTNVSLESRK